MDPLSITASIIAILGAASTIGSTIGKLRAACQAPELFDELSKAVESMSIVLDLTRVCLRDVQETELGLDILEDLGRLTRRAELSLLRLQGILEFKLRSSEGLDGSGRTKVNRLRWIRLGPEIERVKQEIRDATMNLHAGLASLNTISGSTTRRQLLQIQSTQLALSNMAAENWARKTLDREQTWCGQRSAAQFTPSIQRRQITTAGPTYPVASSGAVHHDPSIASPELAAIRSSSSCDCKAYVQTSRMTPKWLANILGQLRISCRFCSHAMACGQGRCCGSLPHTLYAFQFPSWWSSRMVEVNGRSGTTFDVATTWTLKTYIVVPWDHEAYQAIIQGDLVRLQRLMRRGRIHPRMIGDQGSLTQLAIISRQHKCYSVLVQSGFESFSDPVSSHNILLCLRVLAGRRSLALDNDDVASMLQHLDLPGAVTAAVMDRTTVPLSVLDGIQARQRQNFSGTTTLHWACMIGAVDIVRAVLARDEDPDVQDHNGNTALHIACGALANHFEIVKLLLLNGARVDIANHFGSTALFRARDADTALALISYGADLLYANDLSHQILHVIAGSNGEWSACDSFDPARHPDGNLRWYRLVKTLVEHGADVNARTPSGITPLMLATTTVIAKALLQNGAQIDHVDVTGSGVLHVVKEPEVAELLLVYGAQVNFVDKFGATALHYRAHEDREEAIKVLTSHGADIYATDNDGETPFHWAIRNDSMFALKALREASEQNPRRDYRIATPSGHNYLHFAAFHASPDTMAQLSLFDLRGHDPDAKDKDGDTPDKNFYHNFCYDRKHRPNAEERRAWAALMAEARRQNSYGRISEIEEDGDNDPQEIFFDAQET